MSYRISRKEYYKVRPQWAKKLLLSVSPSLLRREETYTETVRNMRKVSAIVEEEVREINERKLTSAPNVHRSVISISPSFQKKIILPKERRPACVKMIEKHSDSVVVFIKNQNPIISFKIEEI